MVDAMDEIVEVLAIAVLGPMLGAEFAVAAFFHPILGRLPDDAFRSARSDSSRLLGRVMPFWYATALALLVVLAALVVTGPQRWMAGIGVGLMALVVLLSVTVLVPINNRIVAWPVTGEVSRAAADRWDRLHWLRVVLVAAAFVLLLIATR